MSQQKGLFITVEGVEGVGKSTNITYIGQWLSDQGIDYIHTREPGGTPLAEEIRSLLLQPRDEGVCETTELLLMFAARAQHLNSVIKPALSRGVWVLCDRFTDATYAYQGGGRQMDMDIITLLEQQVQQGFQPDATLLLDLPVEVGLARASQRGELDRFEQEKNDFFQRVRNTYLERARSDEHRFWLVDAEKPLDAVQVQINQALWQIVNKKSEIND